MKTVSKLRQAEMEHVALGDLGVKLCDEAADRGVSVPDLSGTIGFV